MEASDTMGIPTLECPRAEGQSSFSDDIFRIELCCPGKSHLSVIDVPGIFRTTEKGKTTDEDKLLVINMVHRYIENPRTIILAVVAANLDIATTEILDMAAEVDPVGQRTLGILTKPDLVDKGAEHDTIDLVRGRKKRLKLGYCVVRNRGKQKRNLTSAERNRLESSFFQTEPWSCLERGRVGISALSPRLRDLLSRITPHEFPAVIREITDRIVVCEEELQDLGPTRQTLEQQRRYLLGIATKFQEIVTFAVEAQYGRQQLLRTSNNMRLATLIVDANTTFSEELEKRGHTMNFCETKYLTSKRPRKFKSMQSRKLKLKRDVPTPVKKTRVGEGQDEGSKTLEPSEYPELLSVLPTTSGSFFTQVENILVWIERAYKSSRGFELGSFNPSILPTLFKELSIKWEELAGRYITKVIVTIHHFSNTLLTRLCPEERVMNTLWPLLLDELLQRYRKLVKHVQFILRTESSGNLLTTNHYFSETLDKLRSKHSTEPTNSFAFSSSNASQRAPLSKMEHTVRDIHDILLSYYKLARKRFVDNVCV